MKITTNWRTEAESNGGIKLIFAEKRIRKDGKNKGEEYLFEDVFYYNNIQTALQSFLIKSLEDSEDVKDCLERIKTAEKQILLSLKQTL